MPGDALEGGGGLALEGGEALGAVGGGAPGEQARERVAVLDEDRAPQGDGLDDDGQHGGDRGLRAGDRGQEHQTDLVQGREAPRGGWQGAQRELGGSGHPVIVGWPAPGVCCGGVNIKRRLAACARILRREPFLERWVSG